MYTRIEYSTKWRKIYTNHSDYICFSHEYVELLFRTHTLNKTAFFLTSSIAIEIFNIKPWVVLLLDIDKAISWLIYCLSYSLLFFSYFSKALSDVLLAICLSEECSKLEPNASQLPTNSLTTSIVGFALNGKLSLKSSSLLTQLGEFQSKNQHLVEKTQSSSTCC